VRKSRWCQTIFLACFFCAATGTSSPAQTLTTVVSFSGTDGAYPTGLIQGTDGNFYGTTSIGGANTACDAGSAGCGTVFKLTPGGSLITLYSFCAQPNCTDGWFPQATLVQKSTNRIGTSFGMTWKTLWPITINAPSRTSRREIQRLLLARVDSA